MADAKRVRAKNLKDDPLNKQVKFLAPNRMEYKEFGNLRQGLMIPDKGFTKQLKVLDEELEVAWDWGSEKWEIWRFPKNGDSPFHMLTVQTKDRTYRELGADILLRLQKGDPARFSKGELVRYLDELDNQERRRRAKNFKNKLKDIAIDNWANIHCKIIQVPEKISVGRVVSCQT